MPATSLIPPANPLRKVTLTLEDLTLDLMPAQRVQVVLEWADGMRATVLSQTLEDGDLALLGDQLQGLGDAWAFGEGPKAVIGWAQAYDRSQQARRVRAWARTVE